MGRPKGLIDYEVEDAYDVPEDTVFILDEKGEPVKLEVADDAGDDQT